jgi:hypothetical protein
MPVERVGGISGNVANPQPTVVPAGVLGTVGAWASYPRIGREIARTSARVSGATRIS